MVSYPSKLQLVNDSTGVSNMVRINAALAALPATGGEVDLPSGSWYVKGAGISYPHSGAYLDGQGQWATTLLGVGSGDVVRMYDTLALGARTVQGGGVRGLTIDISAMANGSSGLHIGDIFNLQWDAGVRGAATAGATAKNIWLDNQYLYSEQMRGELFSQNGPVVFDQSATGPGGSPTGSFDRAELSIRTETGGVSDGVVWQNGAFQVNGALSIQGNAGYNAATVYAIMRFLGANSSLANLLLNVGVELDGAGTFSPYTINLAVASNTITQCTGTLDFGAGNAMTSCNNPQQVAFWGPVRGDSNISSLTWGNASSQTVTANAQTLFAYPFGTLVCANGGSSFTGLILSPGSVTGETVTIRNIGAGTLTFAAAGTSNVADGTSDVIPANAQRTYGWNAGTSLWYRTG